MVSLQGESGSYNNMVSFSPIVYQHLPDTSRYYGRETVCLTNVQNTATPMNRRGVMNVNVVMLERPSCSLTAQNTKKGGGGGEWLSITSMIRRWI